MGGKPHFLTDQLTLSQPGGGHIIPNQYYVPSRIFRPCDGPAAIKYNVNLANKQGIRINWQQLKSAQKVKSAYWSKFTENMLKIV